MITDNPQPQPGPSPTPTPKPCVALQIISITTYSEGRAVLEFTSPFPSLLVSKDYMQTCSPSAGGYYCMTNDLKFYLSDSLYSELFT